MGRLRFEAVIVPATVRRTIVGVFLAAVVLSTATCGADGSAARPYGPTLPPVDLRPRLVLEVDDTGIRARPGERDDAPVGTDPPSVPGRSVIEVVNTAASERRLRAEDVFDTGILGPGERSTVVVDDPGAEARTVTVVEVGSGAERGRLEIRPVPAGDAGG